MAQLLFVTSSLYLGCLGMYGTLCERLSWVFVPYTLECEWLSFAYVQYSFLYVFAQNGCWKSPCNVEVDRLRYCKSCQVFVCTTPLYKFNCTRYLPIQKGWCCLVVPSVAYVGMQLESGSLIRIPSWTGLNFYVQCEVLC